MPKRSSFDFDEILDLAQKWLFLPLVVAIMILLLAWSIDWVRPRLQGHGFKELDVPAVVGITLGATMFVLYSFQQQIKRMGSRIDQMDRRLGDFSPAESSRIIQGGVEKVYPELSRILAELGTGPNQQRQLDVIGLTLFTAWPILLGPNLNKIEAGILRGWHINVFHLAPDFIRANASFKRDWASQVDAQLPVIRDFQINRAEALKKVGTTLSVTPYRFFPAVHGFRTAAGHLLISYIHWNSQGLLDAPEQFYELFEPSDNSARASKYRALFDNWIERAQRDAKPPKVNH